MESQPEPGPKRDDGRIIIHFDYDCFYASVFEAENPALRSLPLAVQQKQIVCTANYTARSKGVYKLQLMKDARKVCPELVVVLGEDLTRFRDASKALYNFLRSFVWSRQAERLGFDEVFLDVTSMIDYNVALLNHNDLEHSFFCLDEADPTLGFEFDASAAWGHTWPEGGGEEATAPPLLVNGAIASGQALLHMRLVLGSHLAQHMRHQLEEQKGYTSSVGISTSKLLSKLVGSCNKPKGQTTLIPPYEVHPAGSGASSSNVTRFIDDHEVGRIPGIGFKMAQILRRHVLGRDAEFDTGLVYGGTKEHVTVAAVRTHLGMTPVLLEKLVGGPGAPRRSGMRVWGLLYGVDNTPVAMGRAIPRQISIEDSYLRLDTFEEVRKQLHALARSLVTRMHVDLLDEDDDDDNDKQDASDSIDHKVALNDDPSGDGYHQFSSKPSLDHRRWTAHPRTLRLSTRQRHQPPAPSGSQIPSTTTPEKTPARSFARTSRSMPMPRWVFSLTEHADHTAGRLVDEALVPLFRRLHQDRGGWNLNLLNVAATDIVEAAGDGGRATGGGVGRDIGKMFRNQDAVLREWRVDDESGESHDGEEKGNGVEAGDSEKGDGDVSTSRAEQGLHSSPAQQPNRMMDGEWYSDSEDDEVTVACPVCGARLPGFALDAHQRFHLMGD